jgi:hypothetical protein
MQKSTLLKRTIVGFSLSILFQFAIFAQAGIGLRNLTFQNPAHGYVHLNSKNTYELGVHYRWFDAGIPYSGNLRQTDAERENIHDVFNMHTINLALHYRWKPSLRFYGIVPLQYNQKQSYLEHSIVNGQNVAYQRRVTEGTGLGDIFLGLAYAPQLFNKGMLEGGFALKIPSGRSSATDIWHNAGPQRGDVSRPVDQAIQPGDGTWGFLTELRGSYELYKWFSAYGEAMYVWTPTDLNGVSTFRQFISPAFAEESNMSATDQYMLRGGVSFRTNNSPLIINSGIRMDGVPVNDILGSSIGFRRPGYAVSWENTIMVQAERFGFYLSMPYTYYQRRQQSNPEGRQMNLSGERFNGQASFARFSVFAGMQASF